MEQYINLAVCLLTIAANIIISWMQNKKSVALVQYRLQELEKKQDKHNQLIERTYKLEQAVEDIKEDMKK